MTFIVHDEFSGVSSVERAVDLDVLIGQLFQPVRNIVPPAPFHREVKVVHGVRVVRVLDDMTKEGWGRDCKYEGQQPGHHWIFTIFEVGGGGV